MNAHRVYRVCGTPVRTGCVTCKKRHVKCGEEKPICKRCSKAKRTCEGYLNIPPRNKSLPSMEISSAPTTVDVSSLAIIDDPASLLVPRSSSRSSCILITPELTPGSSIPSSPTPQTPTSLIPALTNEEWLQLEYFQKFTSKSLAGYSSSTFYTSHVLSAISSPSVRHGAIALAALDQHFDAGRLNTSLEQRKAPNPRKFLFALQQNNLAIRHLHKLMSSKTEDLDITLISCILFVVFDSFLGNYLSALIHLRCGLQILQFMQNLQTPLALEWKQEFSPHLLRLGVQSMMFLSPQDSEDRSGLYSELLAATPPSPSPSSFHSIDSAENALYALGASILNEQEGLQFLQEYVKKKEHEAALVAWDHKLKDFLSKLDTRDFSTDSTLRTACLLKIYQSIIGLVIQTQPPTALPASTDPIFEEILNLCSVVDSGALTPNKIPDLVNFSAELGIVAPLFFTCMKCSNIRLKKRAWGLLKRGQRREGMWDAALCAEVVGKVLTSSGLDAGVIAEGKERKASWVGWEECALHKESRLRRKLRTD